METINRTLKTHFPCDPYMQKKWADPGLSKATQRAKRKAAGFGAPRPSLKPLKKPWARKVAHGFIFS